ncbi:hypothetical protein Nit79A3_2342 [Nitrosomonas sp. Is79A3]
MTIEPNRLNPVALYVLIAVTPFLTTHFIYSLLNKIKQNAYLLSKLTSTV